MEIFHSHLGDERKERSSWQWLSEYISELVVGTKWHELEESINHFVLDKMTINFYVFGMLVKSGISNNVDYSLIVTKRRAGWEDSTRKSKSSCLSHSNSLVVAAMARYSALAEDLEIVVYFLAFQETKESPRKIQKHLTNFWVSSQDPQSASKNALRWREEVDEKIKPWPGLRLRYLSRWCTAWRWGVWGWATNWLSLWIANVISGLERDK